MLYDDNFILSLPNDLNEALVKIITTMRNTTLSPEHTFEARDLTIAVMRLHGADVNTSLESSTDHGAVRQTLFSLEAESASKIQQQVSENRVSQFATLMSKSFAYVLSEADTTRIQELLNELRDQITAASGFENDHRRRILERLERLQREVHRRLSDLDRFYGLIGDAGVLLGKFGNDAKPFVDRIREIIEIIWRSQANAEQLPASAKPALLAGERETPGKE